MTQKPSPYYHSPGETAWVRDGFRWLIVLTLLALGASILLRGVLAVQSLQGRATADGTEVPIHNAWTLWMTAWDVALTLGLMALIVGAWYTLEVYLWPMLHRTCGWRPWYRDHKPQEDSAEYENRYGRPPANE